MKSSFPKLLLKYSLILSLFSAVVSFFLKTTDFQLLLIAICSLYFFFLGNLSDSKSTINFEFKINQLLTLSIAMIFCFIYPTNQILSLIGLLLLMIANLNFHLSPQLQASKKNRRDFSNERIDLLNQEIHTNIFTPISKLILTSLTHITQAQDILVLTQSDDHCLVVCEQGLSILKPIRKKIKKLILKIHYLEIEKRIVLCIPVVQPFEVVWVFLSQKKNDEHFSKTNIDFVIEMITQQIEILNLLQSMHNSQKKYSSSSLVTNNLTQRKLLSSIEAEKMNCANYLHDEILQSIIGLHLLVGHLTGDSEITELIDIEFTKLVHSIRNKSIDTFPPTLYNFSFEENIKSLINDFDKKKPASLTNLHLNIAIEHPLPKHIIAPAHRIIKELNKNVLKHSLATAASTTIFTCNQYLHILVEDNGIGIPDYQIFEKNHIDTKKHLGLLSIKNDLNWLNGFFELNQPDCSIIGAKIKIKIPLELELNNEYITN